jgi:outer membrane usher protein
MLAASGAAQTPAAVSTIPAALPRQTADVSNTADPLETQHLYLEVFRGDHSTGLIAHVHLRDGELLLTEADLRAVGIVRPTGIPVDDGGLIRLASLPGLTYRYETASQRLVLQAPVALRPVQRLGYQPPPSVDVRRDQGWLLAYDAYGRHIGGATTFAVGNSLRWFGRAGALELGGVAHAGRQASAYRRLDSQWSYSDPRRLWTWTAGDVISGGTSWSRSVRLGGVQWRKNFGVRPDLITLPIPRFTADAALPSTVDLFVNNVRQYGSEVQDGPFVLDTLPRISGAGQATLIVTDALGRVTQTTIPLYVDQQRLAKGLTEFSLEAGWLRHDFAGAHDGYRRDPVGSGSWRRGLARTFTLEAHGEVGRDVRLAAIGSIWSPGNRWGLVTASYGRAVADTQGNQYTLGYQRNSSRYGFDLRVVRRDEGFRDLGDVGVDRAAPGAATLAREHGTAWVQVARGTLAFTAVGTRDRVARHRTRTLSWTQNFGWPLSVSASLFDDRDSGRGGGLTLSIPIGERLQVSGGLRRLQGRTSASTTVMRRAPYEGGWGWSVRAGDNDGQDLQAGAEVRGRHGEMSFGIDRTRGETGTFMQGGGSLALMGGRLFLSRRIDDAFAVVSTNGVAGVPILNENRLYGLTNAAGYLLIPELRGWQRNRISVDADQLGPHHVVRDLEHLVTPPDRSGALVRFDITQTNPVLFVLLDPAGEPVAAGSRVHLRPTGREVLVGFDGEVYLEDATADSSIEALLGGMTCRYRVPSVVRTETGQTTRGEPLRCETSGR